MEAVDSLRLVILVRRTLRKRASEISEAGLAFVENWAAENRLPGDVERHFRQAFGCLEKIVRLKARERGQGVVRTHFVQRDDVVRVRIEPELGLEKILEDKLVAELGDIDQAGNVLSEKCLVSEVRDGSVQSRCCRGGAMSDSIADSHR